MTVPQPTAPKHRRRWYQYSLRTLLIVVTLFALACSWFAVKLQQAKRQKETVEELIRSGCEVRYDYDFDVYGLNPNAQPPNPAWLRNLLGIDFVSNVVAIYSSRPDTLDHLKSLPQLRQLYLDAQITDDGLEIVRGLTHLQELQLSGTGITDVGLERLSGLTDLRGLHLTKVGITDAGLKYLKRLPRLQTLTLWYVNVSDKGLEDLKELHELRSLWLHETHITDDGVKDLQRVLPNLKIKKTDPHRPDSMQKR
jgi:hypothetical protein